MVVAVRRPEAAPVREPAYSSSHRLLSSGGFPTGNTLSDVSKCQYQSVPIGQRVGVRPQFLTFRGLDVRLYRYRQSSSDTTESTAGRRITRCRPTRSGIRRLGVFSVRLFDPVPPFYPDSRANRLQDYSHHSHGLSLCGPDEAVKQILMVAEGRGKLVAVPADRAARYIQEIEFPGAPPDDVITLAALLKEVLTLRSMPGLDFSIALDWYKIPDPDRDPNTWDNTPTGDLVYKGKYYSAGSARARARTELIEKMAWIIRSHPLYRDSSCIVTVPGHLADGQSFGEKLSEAVANAANKPVVITDCPSGPRPSSKGNPGSSANAEFEIPQTLSGDVIVMDDVCRSGTSMRKVALAARAAGARRVFGLAAVRTLRN